MCWFRKSTTHQPRLFKSSSSREMEMDVAIVMSTGEPTASLILNVRLDPFRSNVPLPTIDPAEVPVPTKFKPTGLAARKRRVPLTSIRASLFDPPKLKRAGRRRSTDGQRCSAIHVIFIEAGRVIRGLELASYRQITSNVHDTTRPSWIFNCYIAGAKVTVPPD